MRTFAIGTIAIVLLAAACASAASVDAESSETVDSPVTTSPVAASPATTSPVTTSPIASSAGAPSDDSVAPSEDQDVDPGSEEQEPTVTTQPPKEISETPAESVDPPPTGPVAAAIADLADRLGIDESAVTVVSVEAVIWPDGSLGCPQPGMAYTQVQVDGALIVLSVDGGFYDYHAGGARDPVLCEKVVSVDPGGSIGGGDEDS